jgi:flagellar hook-associated protein 3 FlgL
VIGRVTNEMLLRSTLADIQSASTALATTQQRMSSGKQLTKPSDDPLAVGQALGYRSDLAVNRQHQRNVADATSWLDATDTALDNVGQLMQRARELLVSGGSDDTGVAGRQNIAIELTQLIDSVKSAANAQQGGRYLFAGSKTQTPPYAQGASDAYAGNTGTVTREIGPGVQIDVNTVGSSVIGDDTTGLLKTLRDAVADLQAGNGANLRGADLAALDTAQDTLLNARAVVGSRSGRLDIASSRLTELEQVSMNQISNVEDADMAETLIHYSMQQAVYQAALKAGAGIVQPSLMDFLR